MPVVGITLLFSRAPWVAAFGRLARAGACRVSQQALPYRSARCLHLGHYGNDFSPEPSSIHQTFSHWDRLPPFIFVSGTRKSPAWLHLPEPVLSFKQSVIKAPIVALGTTGIVLPCCLPLCPVIREAFQKHVSRLRQPNKGLLSPKRETTLESFTLALNTRLLHLWHSHTLPGFDGLLPWLLTLHPFLFFISVAIWGWWAPRSQRIGKCASLMLGKDAAASRR